MSADTHYAQATIKTAADLGSIARSPSVMQLTKLTLPEIEAVVELIAHTVPAGNVPGVILSGLARLAERKLPAQTVQRDINLLFKGVEQALDRAMYGAFFAGPAAVIWAYQNLLRLAGKNPEDAFPEGAWQFYVNYALRDDTARHANETHGFDTLLGGHGIRLSPVDRITAWAMAAIHGLHQYSALLENEWRERVHIHLLREVTGDPHTARLYREWGQQRPYARGEDAAPGDDYPAYRRAQFDQFIESELRSLDGAARREWEDRVRAAERRDLPAYQRQMSILAYLDPGAYSETRVPLKIEQAHVGIIYKRRYFLVPACAPGTRQPVDVAAVRAQVAWLVQQASSVHETSLMPLACLKRSALAAWRSRLSPRSIQALDALRFAPILFNADPRPRVRALSELRQAERGIGDHALTLFDTGETIVFDQSHIFFDGTWGAALAEILTNEALSWAAYLNTLPPARPDEARPIALVFEFQAAERALIRNAPQVAPEASAETDLANLHAIHTLRKIFKQRSERLQLSVNDLLVLYRAIHAATYQPDRALLSELKALARDRSTRAAAQATLDAIDEAGRINPSVLIPVDASQRDPRQRLYPMCFEVPLRDLDLIGLHQRALLALDGVTQAGHRRQEAHDAFDRLQRTYLATLAGFGAFLAKAKIIAVTGESATVGSIKLLAHMPSAMQRLLDRIPGRFDMLNDLIKGREVMSNVGAVAPASTLTRFMTAKDDNEKKTLAWGVLTDASGALRITLRDFRPHVALWEAAGRKDVAQRVAQDTLDAYVRGLNSYIRDLQRITLASRDAK